MTFHGSTHGIDSWGQSGFKFIEQYGSDQPFAMMVGFPGPHCPYDPDERFFGGYRGI
ncbi:MAG: hypothetical protein CM1200mP39_13900 [Dehalococcoidia bacterium]|nr:MAG: hypothetical protein CM1200mP39_13900 [Dehalococcoidia bacterium]